MNIISISAPTFANAANTLINLTLETDKFGIIPFTASPNDSEKHGRDLFAQAMAGDFGPIAPFVPPVVTQAQINAAADRMIAKHMQDALPMLLEVVTKLAAGVDKAALKVFDDAVKAEKAKKA